MTNATSTGTDSFPGISRRIIVIALVAAGFGLAVFGNAWGPLVFDWLPKSELGAWLELIVPFLPMLFIGLGAVVFAGFPSTRYT